MKSLVLLAAGAMLVLFSLSIVHPPATGDLPEVQTLRSTAELYDEIRTDLSDYIYPTDAFRKMTSTFAEYRRTHFHGGVDIGTGSTTGFKVYAMRDGYVSRIHISPHGYGKMLWVKHADGYYTTYAHLDRFNAEIDARALREQQRLECYPVRIDCEPDEFPVRKGDIIAYTGETGVGTPHLHFEIRDENFNFINPLLCENVNVYDDIPPTIRKIAVSPLDENSLVEGEWRPSVFSVKAVGRSTYRIDEVIQITGLAGFAIDARDISNGSNFRHGVYSHELYVNDSLLYTVRLDRAPSDDAHQIGLHYDWNLMGRGRFETLYKNSPNTLPFYLPRVENAGIINTAGFPEGPNTFRIVSTDFHRNSSVVTGKLIFNHPPDFSLVETGDEFEVNFADFGSVTKVLLYMQHLGAADWGVKTVYTDAASDRNSITLPTPDGNYDILKVVAENRWGTRSRPQIHYFRKPEGPSGSVSLRHEIHPDFVRVVALTDKRFTAPPTLVINEGMVRRTITLTALDIDHYVGTFRPLESHAGTRRLVLLAEVNGQVATANSEFDLYPIVAGESGSLSLDDGRLMIEYGQQAVFKTLFMTLTKDSHENDITYVLGPETTVLNSGFTATVHIDPTQSKQGLFANLMGREELLATSEEHTGHLTGRITRSLGQVYVAADNTPPYISRLTISNSAGRKPRISFGYGDNLSGVDYQELKMYIDGVAAVPEIDGEKRRAYHQVTEPLSPGSHLLTIRIKDRMGNSREVEQRFTVR
jgi:hypothetical protein